MYSVLFIFGRYAVAPLIIAFAITNAWIIDLTLTQALILLFCQLFSVFLSCAIVRFQLGRRWRAGLTAKHMGARIFWGGFLHAPFEGHHVSGGAFFCFSVGNIQLFRQYVGYLHYYRYTKPD
ncbi:diguanylate cyclase/cyclic diguanylate phosphodiesterase [Klebsiella michiganensis]|uniref:Diguanylate cyclase/cyclic diguanylate phosphodiesterase n=1 Tax=Klebsiella michiganensis TaxID=1134687 RepID=A0A7H4MUF0_9ENTR|nr:diguanylate cyclase/cyclic diguanylate phosphodiesterase [Klebsiella michiganensis]